MSFVESEVEKYFKDACDILDSLNIEYGPIDNVTINRRAKARWGRCTKKVKPNSYDIEISSRLLEDGVEYKAVMDTMIHELLHAHKDRMKHTGEWKTCANLVNMYYGYNIKRATSSEEKNVEDVRITQAKYIVSCDTCGEKNYYQRKGRVVKLLMRKPTGTCTCGVCGGTSFTVNYC